MRKVEYMLLVLGAKAQVNKEDAPSWAALDWQPYSEFSSDPYNCDWKSYCPPQPTNYKFEPIYAPTGDESWLASILGKETQPMSCQTDDDCSGIPKNLNSAGVERTQIKRNQVCVQHMMEYNDQKDSGRGCWDTAVCQGTGSFWCYDDRKIQWFCSQEQKDKWKDETDKSNPTDWQISSSYPSRAYSYTRKYGDPHFAEFKEACQIDQDCGEGQYCTDMFWEFTESEQWFTFSNGKACYFWDDIQTQSYVNGEYEFNYEPVCPGPQWGLKNRKQSYWTNEYKQFGCPGFNPLEEEIALNLALSMFATSVLAASYML